MPRGKRHLWNEKRIINHDLISTPSVVLLWLKTGDFIPTKHAIHHCPNLQQPIRRCWSSKWDALSEYQAQITVVLLPAFFLKKCPFVENWILALRTTSLLRKCPSLWILESTTCRTRLKGWIPWFPRHFAQSTTVLKTYFQDSHWFFKDCKTCEYISLPRLLGVFNLPYITVCHTFLIM